jgi:hypothetical protein
MEVEPERRFLMVTRLNEPEQGAAQTTTTRGRAGYRVTEWALGIWGAIAAFVGGFILVGGDNASVGLGGEVSWKVQDIDPAWGYGLLIGGALAVIGALLLAWYDRTHHGPEDSGTGTGWADVVTHAIVFLLVNAFLWAQDLVLGDGLNYAYLITIPWAIGLGAHAASVYSAEHRPAP